MACGGCRGIKGSQPTNPVSDLRKFAFLSPRQLRLLEQQEAAQKAKEQAEEGEGE